MHVLLFVVLFKTNNKFKKLASVASTVKEVEEKLVEDFDGKNNLSELNSDFEFGDEQPHLHGSMTAVSVSLVPEAQIDDVQRDEDIADDDYEEVVSPSRKRRRLVPHE